MCTNSVSERVKKRCSNHHTDPYHEPESQEAHTTHSLAYVKKKRELRGNSQVVTGKPSVHGKVWIPWKPQIVHDSLVAIFNFL